MATQGLIMSEAILSPQPMPTEVVPFHELSPILQYLREDSSSDQSVEFGRGIVHPDGRLDLCKQGVGYHLPEVTKALQGKHTHSAFLDWQ